MSHLPGLRLGMFVMPIHAQGKPLAECIDEDLELAVQCEELGIHDFWVGEHHSSSVENIVMPEIFTGDPGHVTRQLLELREEIGPFGTLVLTAHDWDDRKRWTDHLELFAREVVPAFNKAIGAA